MKLIRYLDDTTFSTTGCVATIGNFDGVHRGHQRIIQQVVASARALNLPSVLMLFEPQPREYFLTENPPVRLFALRDKIMAIQKLGVDYLICLRFNKKFAEISAENFIADVLIKKLGTRKIFLGQDFCFGYQRAGNIALLKERQREFNYELVVLADVNVDDKRMSSTAVRTALGENNFQKVAFYLDRPYTMNGRVLQGDKRGRLLGVPTANLNIQNRAANISGVFCVKVLGIMDVPILGVANLGTRPTVDGSKRSLEIHLLDFNRDIYGKRLTVEFHYKLREEKKFASLNDLKQQLQKDILAAHEYFLMETL